MYTYNIQYIVHGYPYMMYETTPTTDRSPGGGAGTRNSLSANLRTHCQNPSELSSSSHNLWWKLQGEMKVRVCTKITHPFTHPSSLTPLLTHPERASFWNWKCGFFDTRTTQVGRYTNLLLGGGSESRGDGGHHSIYTSHCTTDMQWWWG